MKKFSKIGFAILFGILAFNFHSCTTENPDGTTNNSFGWFGTGAGGDDLGTMQDDINFNSTNPPASADLSENFPPVGNQEQYGTCVAWAVGYAHKSFLEAKDKGYTTSQMTDQNKVFSPKYLFLSIAADKKGADCNGTGFADAFDVVQTNGIPKMATVPYTDLGDCSGSVSSYNSEAADFKIDSYREIVKGADFKNDIKRALADGKAVTFGAELGEEFMSWNSSDVMYSQSSDYNGQHAYHAMILCGYDDNKGTNGAFHVQNSWGTSWGDQGKIWVDQDFFVNSFSFCAFIATNKTSVDDNGNNTIVPETGTDVLAWDLSDKVNGDPAISLNRTVTYDVYNSGTTTITADKDWNVLYLLYNAYNATDYKILIYDYYSNDYGNLGQNDELATGGLGAVGNWWNYVNVQSGESIAQAVYPGTTGSFDFTYNMPNNISGSYYLVLLADGFDVIQEDNEDNNFFFLTGDNGDPLIFSNGIITNMAAKSTNKSFKQPKLFDNSPVPTARTSRALNAYKPSEIKKLIKHEKETGRINIKINEYLKNANKGVKRLNNR